MAGRPPKMGALMRPEKPLTEDQIRAAIMIAEGVNKLEVSKKLGIPKDQVYRWCEKEAFTREVQAHQAVRFVHLVPDAQKTLEDLMRTGKSEKIKLAAALAILDRAGHKPIDRSISVNVNENANNLSEEDLFEAARFALSEEKKKQRIEERKQKKLEQTVEAEYRVIEYEEIESEWEEREIVDPEESAEFDNRLSGD